MTQEDKNLLLKDLCSRLPYRVIVKYKSREKEGNVKITCSNIGYVTELGNGWWKECKPYLFSMSNMTEEQYKEYLELEHSGNMEHLSLPLLEWLNKNNFDYRGLIPKGLAIDCTNLNIY